MTKRFATIVFRDGFTLHFAKMEMDLEKCIAMPNLDQWKRIRSLEEEHGVMDHMFYRDND